MFRRGEGSAHPRSPLAQGISGDGRPGKPGGRSEGRPPIGADSCRNVERRDGLSALVHDASAPLAAELSVGRSIAPAPHFVFLFQGLDRCGTGRSRPDASPTTEISQFSHTAWNHGLCSAFLFAPLSENLALGLAGRRKADRLASALDQRIHLRYVIQPQLKYDGPLILRARISALTPFAVSSGMAAIAQSDGWSAGRTSPKRRLIQILRSPLTMIGGDFAP